MFDKSYNYNDWKEKIFTDEGISVLLKVFNKINDNRINERFAMTIGELMKGIIGEPFIILACIDYLIERGILKNVYFEGSVQEHILKVEKQHPLLPKLKIRDD